MKLVKLPEYDLLIIDGQHLAYRCFYAQIALKTSTNIAAGLFYGFLRCIVNYSRDYGKTGSKVVVAWESPSNSPLVRKSILPSYKGNRKTPQVDFLSQAEDLKKILTALGKSQYYSEGYEADDTIYFLADRYKKLSRDVLIISGDKDMRQQVCERIGQDGAVHVLTPKTAHKKNDEVFRVDEVCETYNVGEPQQLVAFLALVGDTTDSIPRTGRFKEETAVEFIKHCNREYAKVGRDPFFPEADFIGSLLSKEDREQFLLNYSLIDLSPILSVRPCPVRRLVGEVNRTVAKKLFSKYEVNKLSIEDFL